MRKITCPVCKSNIKIQNYRLHLFKAHQVLPINLHYLLERNKLDLENLTEENIRQARLPKTLSTANPAIVPHGEASRNNQRMLYIMWDDIIFDDGAIRISSVRVKDFLHPIQLNGVFKELNQIKNEYFLRLHGKEVYSFKFDGPRLRKLESPGWNRFRSQIKLGKQYFKFDLPSISIRTREITKGSFSKVYKSALSKNGYLKLLAVNHHLDFPLILIKEDIGQQQEQSILFRTYNIRGNTIVFWENINEGRATHVFILKNNFESRFKTIQSFIGSPASIKRHRLHLDNMESRKLKRELSYHCAIRHNNLRDYRKSLLATLK